MFPKVAPRPRKLTNRACCFSDEQLAATLRKRDDDLMWSDFAAIFSISNCAATYEEQLYFVPLAFAHQARSPIDGLEYMSGMVEFFARNADALRQADLLETSQNEFFDLLKTWTCEFRIVHFDAAACARKGWTVEYSDYVENSPAATELLELLVGHEDLGTAAERFVRDLASGTSSLAAAWFVEIARAVQECSIDFLAAGARKRGSWSPDRPGTRVQSLLTDPDVLTPQFNRATGDRRLLDQSPTYWHDVATALGFSL